MKKKRQLVLSPSLSRLSKKIVNIFKNQFLFTPKVNYPKFLMPKVNPQFSEYTEVNKKPNQLVCFNAMVEKFAHHEPYRHKNDW